MLVMMFATVTWAAACLWCSLWHYLLDARPLAMKLLLDPIEHRRHGGVLLAQALHQLERQRRVALCRVA